jgi:hypothetical protein
LLAVIAENELFLVCLSKLHDATTNQVIDVSARVD